MKLPVAETLHIAHVLVQTMQGMLAGANRRFAKGNKRAWSSHIFAAKDGSGGREARAVVPTPPPVTAYTRLLCNFFPDSLEFLRAAGIPGWQEEALHQPSKGEVLG